MGYSYLGRTGVEVSKYTLETMSFGSNGNTNERKSINISECAIDCDFSFIDAAAKALLTIEFGT
jgi:aryl-alcohol dehydrogenase-like predicted oxidoreductase